MFFLSFLSNEIESRKLPGVIVGPKGVLEWRALCLSVAGKLLKTAVSLCPRTRNRSQVVFIQCTTAHI
ncbi:hypothetical protein QQF64_027995 [Cirrhinus molitorella]|uniref:Uncharacterized protein n=1 Tax=Cirrhinus molitorella TaxID=172907 RepID=A0ABR3NEN7_9TELE